MPKKLAVDKCSKSQVTSKLEHERRQMYLHLLHRRKKARDNALLEPGAQHDGIILLIHIATLIVPMIESGN